MWQPLLFMLALTSIITGGLGGRRHVSSTASTVRAATCAGGDTLTALAQRWADAVHATDPKLAVAIDTKVKLAAGGFTELLAGEADCVLFVREPFPAEDAAFRAKFGRAPSLIPIAGGSYATKGATHAIAIYVNAANPLRGLSLAQLDALFSAERRRGGAEVRTWGDLGLSGAWAMRPIHRYGMLTKRESGNPPGVVNYLQHRVLLDGPFRTDIAQQVDQPGEQALAVIVRRVGEDVEGVGYSGFGYAAGPVRVVPLAEQAGGPFVAGTALSVADRSYPLSRRIYVMIDRRPGQALDPALKAFLAEALSPHGQAMLKADKQGFLPLTDEDAASAQQLVK